MIKWYLDKTSKIPLYLQLKDLIKYYISTGVIKDNERLPGVIGLSKELGINFETVRNAYKELEKEGLISMKRGKGTFALLPGTQISGSSVRPEAEADVPMEPAKELKHAVKRLLQEGRNEGEIKTLIDGTIKEAYAGGTDSFVIFTECSEYQVREISGILQKELKVDVRPVLVGDLKTEIDSVYDVENRLLAIVTTGFHLNEVREIVGRRSIYIQILITNMSPETRARLASFGKDTKFGFISRDMDSNLVLSDVLKIELGEDLKLSSCLVTDDASVDKLLNTVDVLLVTPTVYEVIKQRTPERLPVFNVFDCIDPMSLKIVQAHISQKIGPSVR